MIVKMKIILIILSIIGLLKLVSLFILCAIELYCHFKHININNIEKEYGLYKDDIFYLIPTISFSKGNVYFELMACWLCFQYYSAYSIKKYEDTL